MNNDNEKTRRTVTIGSETFPCCEHGYVVTGGQWCPYPGCPNGYEGGGIRQHPRMGVVRRVRCKNKRGTVWYQWRPTKEPLLREVKS